MYTYEFVKIDSEHIHQYSQLLTKVFPSTDKFTNEFLEWEYLHNPNGPVVGFNAYFGTKLVAHYATQPISVLIHGSKIKGLLSINTATHPDHRNNNLFLKLVNLTCDYAKNNDHNFIFGIANSNSTHGFINKLGFQFVTSLKTKIGIGKIFKISVDENHSFERIWTERDLLWRVNNPSKQYFINNNEIIAPVDKFSINAPMHVIDKDLPKNLNLPILKGLNLIKLYVGIDNSIDWKKSYYFDIPKQLKPSPLNMIFKDLTQNELKLDSKSVKIRLIDFDGF